LSNLHNPSGAFLPGKTIRELADAAGTKGAWLFIDEVYLEFLPAADARPAFGLAENIFTGSSLTKVFGLAGFRCGWILAPAPLAGKMRRMMDHLFVQHVFVGEMLAARAFPLLDSIRERNRPLFEANQRTVQRFIERTPALVWAAPAAGIVGFPRLRGDRTGDALAGILRERYGTAVVPGSFFEDPRHFRLGFGVRPEVLTQGLANIGEALAEWKS
jgi:aspartate/methionine/tyrosine aminotransferase